MSDTIRDQIAALEEEASELSQVKEDIVGLKADISVNAIAKLISKFSDSIDELLEGVAKKEYFDKTLGSQIKDVVSDLVKAIAEVKPPTVTVNPRISIDLKPLEAIAEGVANQNKNIIELLQKSNDVTSDGSIKQEILKLIESNNNVIAKAFRQVDYSEILREIATNVKKEDNKRMELLKVQRDENGRAEYLKPVYSK